MSEKYAAYLHEGRLFREQCQYNHATCALTLAYDVAIQDGQYDMAAGALSELVLIPYLRYYQDGNKNWLSDMEHKLNAAEQFTLGHNLPRATRAILQLRLGQLYYELGDKQKSRDHYLNALALSADGGNNCEILSHYGLSDVLSGSPPGKGLQKLHKALNEARSRAYDSDWHRLAVISGMLLRLAHAHAYIGEEARAEVFFANALSMAADLAQEHSNPHQLRQAQKLRQVMDRLLQARPMQV